LLCLLRLGTDQRRPRDTCSLQGQSAGRRSPRPDDEATTPSASLPLSDPSPPPAEVALALRASVHAVVRPTSDFDGTITAVEVPVRWGSIPARLYRHTGAGPLPAVAFFHGGGFTQGS